MPFVSTASMPFWVDSTLDIRAGAKAMNYDRNKVDEMVLALLYLTITEEQDEGARTWKSHDWDTRDRLHARGYISDPKSKAKSVVLSPEGLKLARALFERHFGVTGNSQ